MKNVFITGVLLLSVCLPAQVFAHESKESGNTVILVHVNPFDTPVANKPAGVRVVVTQVEGNFPVDECDCKATISYKGKPLVTQSLFTDGEISSLVKIVFPQAGIYEVEVTGTPLRTKAFEPFDLKFDIRVVGKWGDPTYKDYMLYIYCGGVVLVALLGGYLYTRKHTRKHEK